MTAPSITETRDAGTPSPHIPALDGLRGLAILLVMIYHFTGGTDAAARGLDKWFTQITGCGWCGVDLFFVLSGFLITGILFDTRKSRMYLRDFFARRVLRIFPLYYGVLLVLFVALPGVVPGVQRVAEHQGWLWTYTTNIGMFFVGGSPFRSEMIQTGHFWSLAVEEQFYLVWPFAVLCVRPRTLMRVCVLVAACALVSRSSLAAAGYGSVSMLTPCRLDGLMVGSFLALGLRSGWSAASMAPVARRVGLGCGVALAVILLTVGLDESHWMTYTAGYTLLATFFGALLVLVLAARPSGLLAGVFNGRVLRFFGKYSYGLYVWHYLLTPAFAHYFSVNTLVDRVFGHYWPARIAFVLLSMAASVAVAYVSWHAIEKHFLRLKPYFDAARRPHMNVGQARASGGAALTVGTRGAPSP